MGLVILIVNIYKQTDTCSYEKNNEHTVAVIEERGSGEFNTHNILMGIEAKETTLHRFHVFVWMVEGTKVNGKGSKSHLENRRGI